MFIDYNISGMSYIHLKNALFLQPLPEHSSVPSIRHGIFTSATVPPSLVATPPGQSATMRTHAEVAGNKRGTGITTEEARKHGTAWEKEVRERGCCLCSKRYGTPPSGFDGLVASQESSALLFRSHSVFVAVPLTKSRPQNPTLSLPLSPLTYMPQNTAFSLSLCPLDRYRLIC